MKKDKQLNIRIDNELLSLLETKSKQLNITKTEYITQAIKNSKVKSNNKKHIVKLIGSINKIGNNLNQIARVLNIANRYNYLNDIDYKELLDELTIIEYQLFQIQKSIKQ